jgi:demethylmenaquinone methyltransferase/2-methoxy-6-polyprenyl-1,4-benzoquinol methylase
LLKGYSESIQFPDNQFDVAMVAFGVRNFSDPLAGLKEMYRVVKPGGMVMVLEFSKPVSFPFRQIYNFYFLNILPFFGRMFSNLQRAAACAKKTYPLRVAGGHLGILRSKK